MQNRLYRLHGSGTVWAFKVTDGCITNLQGKTVAIVSQTRRMLTITVRVLVGEVLYDMHFRDPPDKYEQGGFCNLAEINSYFHEWPDCLEDEGQEENEEEEEEQSSV